MLVSVASAMVRRSAAATSRRLLSARAGEEMTVVPDANTHTAPTLQFKSDLGVISGQPVQQANRTVYVYSPARNAMQSGTYQTRYWKIEFPVEERWENPLMGWTSSSDPAQALDMQLKFETKEQAIAFCNKNGWSFIESTPNARNPSLRRTYAENFKFDPSKKIRFIRTK